jgi:Flp pilus assembly protein TadG
MNSIRLRRGGDHRRGATVIEFAIVAPVMFLAVFGLIEMGRMLMIQQALTNAAREACREAALVTTTTTEEVDSVVRTYLQSVVSNVGDVDKVRVTVAPDTLASLASGTSVSVGVQVSFADVSWVPGFVFGGDDLVISGRSTKRRE